MIFFWTPPHFWALAIRYADDYRAADVPMLPAVVPVEVAVREDGLLHGGDGRDQPACWRRSPISGRSTSRRRRSAARLFLWGSIDLGKAPTPQRSMRLFAFSISYVTLLFGALTVDVLVRHGL